MTQPQSSPGAVTSAPPPSPTRSDAALFAAAQTGDFGAFEAVVGKYHERVYRLALGMMHNGTDAEEVVQETFLNVFRALGSFKNESSPGTWIYRVAVNVALMRLRQKKRKPLLSIEDQEANVSLPGASPLWAVGEWARQPEERLLSKELAERIEGAIDRLPEKYKLVLLLRDVEGQSNEEVAHTLGLTVPTVKSRLHRSRLFVRQALETYFKRK
ncbi:MAG TPA: sigma-70 family RNA polymerase sigma factor [Myxococcota bacterium]|nr:sigma-70 family RNA polymerase sigma factor [Myxococcota bacterium]